MNPRNWFFPNSAFRFLLSAFRLSMPPGVPQC